MPRRSIVRTRFCGAARRFPGLRRWTFRQRWAVVFPHNLVRAYPFLRVRFEARDQAPSAAYLFLRTRGGCPAFASAWCAAMRGFKRMGIERGRTRFCERELAAEDVAVAARGLGRNWPGGRG